MLRLYARQELVAHFERQNQLSNDEIKALLDQGFLASDAPARIQDLCGFAGDDAFLPRHRREAARICNRPDRATKAARSYETIETVRRL